jgi:hypothetical protein
MLVCQRETWYCLETNNRRETDATFARMHYRHEGRRGSIGLFLGGCATQAQRQYQAIVTNDKAASEKVAACAAAVYNSPDAAVLRSHMPLKATDATLQQMSDTSVVGDQEINAIFVTHPRVQECRKAYLADISQSTPSLVPIYVTFYNRRWW